MGLSDSTVRWLVIVAAAFLGGALVFGSLLWFVVAHLGQVFAFVLLVMIVRTVVQHRGVTDENKWLVFGFVVVALALLFVPLDLIRGLREASVVKILPAAAGLPGVAP